MSGNNLSKPGLGSEAVEVEVVDSGSKELVVLSEEDKKHIGDQFLSFDKFKNYSNAEKSKYLSIFQKKMGYSAEDIYSILFYTIESASNTLDKNKHEINLLKEENSRLELQVIDVLSQMKQLGYFGKDVDEDFSGLELESVDVEKKKGFLNGIKKYGMSFLGKKEDIELEKKSNKKNYILKEFKSVKRYYEFLKGKDTKKNKAYMDEIKKKIGIIQGSGNVADGYALFIQLEERLEEMKNKTGRPYEETIELVKSKLGI